MWMRSVSAKRFVLIACAVVAGAGCDLVAVAGQTLTLGNQGSVFGTGGNAQTAPNPAVRVQLGGNVTVEDASLFGGGLLVQQVGQQSFGAAGAGIASAGNNSIRVQRGMVSGGSVLLQVPVTQFDRPAPAIAAVGAFVEITGGTVRGGSIVSQVGAVPMGVSPNLILPAPAITANGGTLRVTGGTVMSGAIDPPDSRARLSVATFNTQVDVLGGTFSDGFGTIDGRARISGGTFESLVFLNTSANSCSEIRGGQFSGLAISGGRVIIAGTGLALTSAQSGGQTLTGTLQNGQLVNAGVVQSSGGVVQLVTSGAAGCP